MKPLPHSFPQSGVQPTLGLMATVGSPHLDREVDYGWLATRFASGGCALLNGWCWTHNEPDSMAHHFSQPEGTSIYGIARND